MKTIRYIITALVVLIASSCAKQDSIYSKYVVEGGKIYPAKPLDFKASAGYKRVVLSWSIPMDPSITTAKLFWDGNTQQKEFSYSDYPSGLVETVIDNLEDRSYTFDVVNYDAEGNASLAEQVTTTPFADGWLSSHAERSVIESRILGTDALVTMKEPTDELAVTRFRYLKKDGTTAVSGNLLSTESVITLPDAAPGQYFEYQSGFCAQEGIDTVWTMNWSKSPKPIVYNIDRELSTVSVTSNQVRDGFSVKNVIDGIWDSASSSWYSAQDASYRAVFPKIIVVDTHLSGDDMMTFDTFVLYQDPAEDAQTRRYIRGVNVYVSENKLNPDDSDYIRNFGEAVASVSLVQTEAVQTIKASVPKKGRYVAFVFRNSYNSFGFLDLWELEALGWCESKINN